MCTQSQIILTFPLPVTLGTGLYLKNYLSVFIEVLRLLIIQKALLEGHLFPQKIQPKTLTSYRTLRLYVKSDTKGSFSCISVIQTVFFKISQTQKDLCFLLLIVEILYLKKHSELKSVLRCTNKLPSFTWVLGTHTT